MASDILQKEIIGLREDDINLLISIARFLKSRTEQAVSTDKSAVKKRHIGFLSDAFVSIADDFDETPDCMKEYV